MSRLSLFLLALTAFAADDPWSKVKELKSGTEIRVLKKGSTQPVIGKIDEATDENLIVVLKNEQTAIPKDQIDRVDYRPARPRVVKESKTTVNDGNTAGEPAAGMNHQQVGPGYSSSSGFNIQGKADFETLYRRPAVPAKKK